MRKSIQARLNVFRYVSTNKEEVWDQSAVSQIESTFLQDKGLSRLSALILNRAKQRNHFDWFSPQAQKLLVSSATHNIVDVAAKQKLIKDLGQLLSKAGIPVILLKGMAFNHNLYSEAAPRGVSDIDILVHPRDIAHFERVFLSLASKVEVEKKYAFDDLYEETWRSKNQQHLIDVHIYLTNPYLFDIPYDGLWERSIPHPAYSNSKLRVLGTEDTICHLVTHMLNDLDFYHYNLLDIALLSKLSKIDHKSINTNACKWGIANLCQVMFELMNQTFRGEKELKGEKKRRLVRYKISLFLIQNLLPIPCRDKSLLHRFKQMCCHLFIVDNGMKFTAALFQYFKSK